MHRSSMRINVRNDTAGTGGDLQEPPSDMMYVDLLEGPAFVRYSMALTIWVIYLYSYIFTASG
jgi:hypothetical protein